MKQSPALSLDQLLDTIADRSIPEIEWLVPGSEAATEAAQDFVANRLAGYALDRNDPCRQGQSDLSPYLHFGHISPQRLSCLVRESMAPDVDKEAFLEKWQIVLAMFDARYGGLVNDLKKISTTIHEVPVL